MRPVSAEFETSQEFGEGATAGIVGNPDPKSGMAYYVWLYGNYQEYGHAGKDIACPIGTRIHAPADGTVLYAGWAEDLPGSGPVRKWLLYYNFGGIVTVIQHAGWISVIAHQSDNDAVYAGMRVTEGQLIGKSGNSKTRTTYVAPHVHLEALVFLDYRTDVRKGIIYGRVNPDPFFGEGIAAQGTITTPAPNPEPTQAKADKMLYITKAKGDTAIWIGDGITRRQIPDVGILESYRSLAKAGAMPIYKNGDTQDWPPAVLGAIKKDDK